MNGLRSCQDRLVPGYDLEDRLQILQFDSGGQRRQRIEEQRRANRARSAYADGVRVIAVVMAMLGSGAEQLKGRGARDRTQFREFAGGEIAGHISHRQQGANRQGRDQK